MTQHEITQHETAHSVTAQHEPGTPAGACAPPTVDAADAGASCTQFQGAIEFIGRRWVGAIVYVLLDGPCRFNELLGKVPNLSDRLLTERLRELETAGVVTREVHPGPPVRVVYELTEAGRALSDIIRGITEWAHEWMPGSAE
jgi:DNA-binding HxlR family transcriptional regulator